MHTVAVDGSPGFALPSATRPSGRMRAGWSARRWRPSTATPSRATA
ncbi:MAG: hypothetical protein R2734_05350 [Nocardioides sp.]